MMPNDTSALLVELAGKERECPICKGVSEEIEEGDSHRWTLCQSCDGTGKAPFFEGVRKPCPAEDNIGDLAAYVRLKGHSKCPICQGRGWVPSKDGMAWIIAATKLGWSVEFIPLPNLEIALFRVFLGGRDHPGFHAGNTNPMMALVLALKKACGEAAE